MLLHENDDFTLVRYTRFLRATLERPHRVLSNCYVNGGLREDLTHICNHQCSEGSGHADRHALIASLGPGAYHARTCEEAGIPGTSTVLLSTAASMQCAVLSEARHQELEVLVAATAAAYCLAESIDLAAAGVLLQEAAREAIHNQVALLAASVAVQPDRFAEFRRELQTQQGRDPGSLAALAVIRGFSAKWS